MPIIFYPVELESGKKVVYYSNYSIQNPNTKEWYSYIHIYPEKNDYNRFYVKIYGEQAKLFSSISAAQEYINNKFDTVILEDYIYKVDKL